MNDRPVAEQHFVPKSYLKRFASNESQKIEVYDKQIAKFTPPKPPTAIAKEIFFYAQETGVEDSVSQELEKHFHPYENMIGTDFEKVLSILEMGKSPQASELEVLCLVTAHLLLRGKGMRNKLKNMRQSAAKQIKEVIPNAQTHENLATFFTEDNSMHILFQEEIKGFFSTLTHKKIRILKAPNQIKFLTSDIPVGEFVSPFTKLNPLEGKFALFSLLHTLPLSPSLYIQFFNPDDLPGKWVTVKTASIRQVQEANARQFRNGERYIYGLNKGDFWHDVKDIK